MNFPELLRKVAIGLVLLAAGNSAQTAYAGSTIQSKCDAGKLNAAAKYAQCRLKVESLATKKADLTTGEKARLVHRCSLRVAKTFLRMEQKYPATDLGDQTQCSDYGDAANLIAALDTVSELVANRSVAAAGSDAFDPAINDASVCTSAGGTWADNTCTPGNSYNCTIGAFCSSMAAALPGELEYYSNAYIGHQAGTGPAAGCLPAHWSAGVTMSTACGGHACLVTAAQICG